MIFEYALFLYHSFIHSFIHIEHLERLYSTFSGKLPRGAPNFITDKKRSSLRVKKNVGNKVYNPFSSLSLFAKHYCRRMYRNMLVYSKLIINFCTTEVANCRNSNLYTWWEKILNGITDNQNLSITDHSLTQSFFQGC